QLDAARGGQIGQLWIEGEELVQAVLDVETRRDRVTQQHPPLGREAATLGRDPDERGGGLVLEPLRDRPDDRDAFVRLPRALRVEDRDHRIEAVVDDAAQRLPVVRVAALALGEDEVALHARTGAGWTPSPGASGGTWMPSTSSTPGHGSTASRRMPSRSTWSQRLATWQPAAMPRPGPIKQPNITPNPSAPAAGALPTAPRIPPGLASLIVIPCARSAQKATSASVWQSSST